MMAARRGLGVVHVLGPHAKLWDARLKVTFVQAAPAHGARYSSRVYAVLFFYILFNSGTNMIDWTNTALV